MILVMMTMMIIIIIIIATTIPIIPHEPHKLTVMTKYVLMFLLGYCTNLPKLFQH